ncbi:MAG: 4-(cytidine 5'-diphospho)-2-C-methyl-D-erythritol kinase [candidate division WOR-3 bacterium]|nr:4-(cytidine 5'-diphospho)-2-C-methyl-D-erythritol kinase [candidate division WOR-3 bacterium]
MESPKLNSKFKIQNSTIKLFSPAKINIGLIIKEKLTSGYHKIETILAPIKLFDTIIIKRANQGLKFTTNKVKNLPSGSDNLVVKAAELFFQELKIKPCVEIFLKKSIPLGAGLGGGSSNAGTVLLGLNQLFQKPLTMNILYQIACQIGMDVPFFLYQTPSYATGRGEILTPIKIPKFNIVLYIPEYFISTRWAYQQIDEMGLTEGNFSLKILSKKLSQSNWQEISKYTVNTFEKVVFPKYNDLLVMKTRMLFCGARIVSLSGSGSAIYGIVPKDRIAEFYTKAKRLKLKLLYTETL